MATSFLLYTFSDIINTRLEVVTTLLNVTTCKAELYFVTLVFVPIRNQIILPLMKKIFILFTVLLSTVIANAQIVYLKGVLQGSQQVPATATGAGGVVILKYDMATNFLQLWGNYRGLSGTVTGSHIHGSAAPGANAPILFNLANTGGTDGGLKGTATLTDAQEADLIAGLMYVNVHTGANPGGEIRAQVTRVTEGKAVFLNGRLQGAQSTPPDTSQATGAANVLLDTSTHTLWITATYTGLSAAANNAHIHTGAPDVSGPVSIFVKFTPAKSGSIDTSRVISVQNETDILNNNTYLNIHTSTYPAGEIRGQLLQSTTMRFFAGVLQGSQEVPAPPMATSGRGTVIVRYNTETNRFELTGDYQNLTSNATISHVHGPAPVGSAANPIFDITNTGGLMGTLTMTRTLTEDEEVQLLAGDWYANVHTINNPNGEVRAQLVPLSQGETQYLNAGLDADEERAAFPGSTIVSGGIGTATAVLDRITRDIYLTASYSNLSSNINNAHIHRGPAAVSGPVSIPLQFVPGNTAGTVTGSAKNISASLMDSIVLGNSYINIHTTNYGSGEIRGQLANLVLPVKLTYFNGNKDQNRIALVWESAQELNLKSYDIEQQNMETGAWIKKGTVNANGGSLATKYRFDDIPLASKTDYLFYRLKMIEVDGKVTYSNIIRINFSKSIAVLTIMPNPVVNGSLRFAITGLSNNQKADVSIIDFNGRLMKRTTASTFINGSVDVSNLSAGMYKLVIKTGDTTLQETFTKQ
jgi:hypothetical protein